MNPKWLFGVIALALGIAAIALLERPDENKLFSSAITDANTQLSPTLSCFESSTATIRVTREPTCPGDLLSLGSAGLEQIRDSVNLNGESITTQTHPLLLARFFAAATTANFEGEELYITSAFRSLERQALLFQSAVEKYGSERAASKWVLPAQASKHPKGLALDINYPGNRQGAQWLDRNGSRFGLCRVYANEWWHFEGVIAPGGNCPKVALNALVDLR